MSKRSENPVIKKYKRCIIIASIVFGMIIIAIAHSVKSPILYTILLLSVFFLYRVVAAIIYTSVIKSVLTQELNPVKFHTVLVDGGIASKSYIEMIESAFYSGELNTAASICATKLRDKKCARYRFFYLVFLVRCYFIVGDLENLRRICDEFESAANNSKNPQKLYKKFWLFKFYSLYLQNDFLGCKQISESALSEKRFMSTVFQQVHLRFSYAIVSYKCGDMEKAKENFEYVVAYAPKFHFANIAKEFLLAIESDLEYDFEKEKIELNDNMQLAEYSTAKKKVRRVRIIAMVGGLIVLLGILVYNSNAGNTRVEAAVARMYEGFDLVDSSVMVEYQGEVVGSFCIADTKEDGLILGALYKYKDKEELFLYDPITNIQPGKLYHTVCYPENYIMSFGIYEKSDSATGTAIKSEKIKVNGNEYVFCILSVEPYEY